MSAMGTDVALQAISYLGSGTGCGLVRTVHLVFHQQRNIGCLNEGPPRAEMRDTERGRGTPKTNLPSPHLAQLCCPEGAPRVCMAPHIPPCFMHWQAQPPLHWGHFPDLMDFRGENPLPERSEEEAEHRALLEHKHSCKPGGGQRRLKGSQSKGPGVCRVHSVLRVRYNPKVPV